MESLSAAYVVILFMCGYLFQGRLKNPFLDIIKINIMDYNFCLNFKLYINKKTNTYKLYFINKFNKNN